MLYQILANPKHESDRRTAFLEQVKAHEPAWIGIVASPEDLIDSEGPVSLANLRLNGYHLTMINVIRYVDGTQLYPVPGTTRTEHPVVNTVQKLPPDHSGIPHDLPVPQDEVLGRVEESTVAEAGPSD